MTLNQPTMNTEILHSAWNRITGQSLPMGVCSFEFESGWYQFEKAGYTEADLLLVVRYLQTEIRKGERKPASLRWRNCVGDLLRFAEEVELARGALRQKPPPTPRENALQSFRPNVVDAQPRENTRTASEAAEKALRELRASVEIK